MTELAAGMILGFLLGAAFSLGVLPLFIVARAKRAWRRQHGGQAWESASRGDASGNGAAAPLPSGSPDQDSDDPIQLVLTLPRGMLQRVLDHASSDRPTSNGSGPSPEHGDPDQGTALTKAESRPAPSPYL